MDRQPRMFRIVAKDDNRLILAVEWCHSIGSKLIHSNLTCHRSTDHPWPNEIRPIARALRMADDDLHLFYWCEDEDKQLLALGLGSNKKRQTQAMHVAYDLCRSWSKDGNRAAAAKTIFVDPTEYYSDDYIPPGSVSAMSSPQLCNYAVALHKYNHLNSEAVEGFFFSVLEDARHFFNRVKYGEWPAALIAGGKQVEAWSYSRKNMFDSAWKWWSEARATGSAVPESEESPPPCDAINLEADAEGIEMVKWIKASFNGEEDTVERVFEKMRREIQSNIKQEEIILTVPVSEVLFTQKQCHPYFRCECERRRMSYECQHCPTRSVQRTAEEIVRGMDPSTEKWAMLEVVMYHGRFRSIDNRRLAAFRRAQELLREQGSERVVRTRIRVFVWRDEFWRFWDHMDYRNDPDGGESIHIKGHKRRREEGAEGGRSFYEGGRRPRRSWHHHAY
ncbi:unnamed protein product [Symbiodinium sp. CCMP2592]|nr:unnamed protein product [Symbiodinium sp. CCMP2592]